MPTIQSEKYLNKGSIEAAFTQALDSGFRYILIVRDKAGCYFCCDIDEAEQELSDAIDKEWTQGRDIAMVFDTQKYFEKQWRIQNKTDPTD
jgi:hypothetical protein